MTVAAVHTRFLRQSVRERARHAGDFEPSGDRLARNSGWRPVSSADVAQEVLSGEHPDGLAVVEHEDRVGVDQQLDGIG